MEKAALKDVRVLDFGSVLAIPICCMYMAMMGAEVIKCESNERLDFTRGMYPADGKSGPNRGGLFQLANMSKKSCTINMNTERGLELAKELIKTADVVMHNFSSRMIHKWGFEYEDLSKINPELIVVSNSGFGRSGPEKDYRAYGRNLHASAGINAHVGYKSHPPGGISVQWSDAVSALAALTATLMALHHRHVTGEGQFIDVAMNEATIAMLAEPMMDFQMNGRVWEPRENQHDFMAPHNCYPCLGDDAWVAIAINSDEEWKSFCKAIGNPSWTRNKHFADTEGRWKNQEELDNHIAAWTRQQSNQEITALLQKAKVATGPVLNPQDIANDPQLIQRGFFVNLNHPELGARKGLSLPWKLSVEDQPRYRYAPLVGEDNHYVFCNLLRISDNEYNALADDKVIW